MKKFFEKLFFSDNFESEKDIEWNYLLIRYNKAKESLNFFRTLNKHLYGKT